MYKFRYCRDPGCNRMLKLDRMGAISGVNLDVTLGPGTSGWPRTPAPGRRRTSNASSRLRTGRGLNHVSRRNGSAPVYPRLGSRPQETDRPTELLLPKSTLIRVSLFIAGNVKYVSTRRSRTPHYLVPLQYVVYGFSLISLTKLNFTGHCGLKAVNSEIT